MIMIVQIVIVGCWKYGFDISRSLIKTNNRLRRCASVVGL